MLLLENDRIKEYIQWLCGLRIRIKNSNSSLWNGKTGYDKDEW